MALRVVCEYTAQVMKSIQRAGGELDIIHGECRIFSYNLK